MSCWRVVQNVRNGQTSKLRKLKRNNDEMGALGGWLRHNAGGSSSDAT